MSLANKLPCIRLTVREKAAKNGYDFLSNITPGGDCRIFILFIYAGYGAVQDVSLSTSALGVCHSYHVSEG